MTNQKVGVLGSGDVARALGTGFVKEGHEVMLGSRSPDKPEVVQWREENGPKARTGTFDEAVGFGDWVVLAVIGKAAVPLVESHKDTLKGKLLIDVTNPLVPPEGDHPLRLFVGGTDSLGEQVQRAVPETKVVKAFNIIGNPLMYKPDLPSGPPTMFYCGDDPQAKETANGILSAFGHEPMDIGGIESARYLEAMVPIWVNYGVNKGTWDHGFKMLSK